MTGLITTHNNKGINSNIALPLFVLLTFAITTALLPIGADGIEVRVSNLTIGKQQFNLINAEKEDIYKVVYNSSVSVSRSQHSPSEQSFEMVLWTK